MKSTRIKFLLLLHFIVLIWGFTGILGKEITLPSDVLVWYRMAIAAPALLVALWLMRKSVRTSATNLRAYAGVGLLIAAHWITFFAAIKMANVSVAVTCMATTALFVSVWEPLVRKTAFVRYEALLGLSVIAGIALIVSFETQYWQGIVIGLISAALAALFSVFNAKLLPSGEPVRMSFYEMLFGFAGVSLYLLFSGKMNSADLALSGRDFMLLLVLGTFATAFAFAAGVWVMRELSPFTVALSINLEPVYTIFLALLIYGSDEKMSPQFYGGLAIILGTLLINASLKARERKRTPAAEIVS
jgi:drug/metabolite transporter (DMT)-like permease